MINRNKQKSFTLIELLVVIVIIGILAGVIMISTSSSIDKANIAKVKVFSESIKNNLMLNLISEWSLDNIVGTLDAALSDNINISDEWGSNNGKTYYGPILKGESNCVSGKCLEFNGNKAYVDMGSGSSLSINKDITIEYWIMQLNGGNWNGYCQETFSRRGCYDICCSDLYTNMNSIYADTMIGDGLGTPVSKWSHVVYTYNYANKMGYYYFNGELKTSRNIGTTYPSYTSYTLGTSCGNLNLSNYSYTFNGRLDEVKLYDTNLSQAQIKQNYIAGLNSMLSNGSISKKEYNERINTLAYE